MNVVTSYCSICKNKLTNYLDHVHPFCESEVLTFNQNNFFYNNEFVYPPDSNFLRALTDSGHNLVTVSENHARRSLDSVVITNGRITALNIHEYPHSFLSLKDLQYLRYLFISDSDTLSTIQDYPNSLDTIEIDFCPKLENIDEVFNISSLRELVVSHNNIKTVHRDKTNVNSTQLETLCLAHNPLKSFTLPLEKFPFLKNLLLKRTLLEELPDPLFISPSLELIDILFTQLKDLPCKVIRLGSSSREVILECDGDLFYSLDDKVDDRYNRKKISFRPFPPRGIDEEG